MTDRNDVLRAWGICPECSHPDYDHRKYCPNDRGNMDEIIEQVAAQVHEDWMTAKRSAGVTTRKLDTTGEELLVPYESLSEQAKELDRGTVRSVLSTLPKLGYQVAALAATPGADARVILTCKHCGFNAGDRAIFETHWQTNHAAATQEGP